MNRGNMNNPLVLISSISGQQHEEIDDEVEQEIVETEFTSVKNDGRFADAHSIASDVCSTILSWIKGQKKHWSMMTHDEQRETISLATILSGDLVRNIVNVVSAEGRRVIIAKVNEVKFVEKGLQATMLASPISEYRHELADSRGQEVMIVVSDSREFFNGDMPEPDAPEKGQSDLPFDQDDKPIFDRTKAGS